MRRAKLFSTDINILIGLIEDTILKDAFNCLKVSLLCSEVILRIHIILI